MRKPGARLKWATLLVVLAAMGSRVAADFNPYKVPRERVAESVRTIALAPVRLPFDVNDAEQVEAEFERLLAQHLEVRGYEVVAPAEFEAIWLRTSQQVGGVFDPLTGETDQPKYEMVRDLAARELARRYGTDAILTSAIIVNTIQPQEAWDRYAVAGEALTWMGEPLRISVRPQIVFAPYLNIILTDLGGAELYAMRMPIKWSTVYVAGGYEKRPDEGVYGDAVRNERVVATLLDQLVALPGATVPALAPTPGPTIARVAPGGRQ